MPDDPSFTSSHNPLEPEAFPEVASILRMQTSSIMEKWDESARQAQAVVGNLNVEEMKDEMPGILSNLANLLEGPTKENMEQLVDRSPLHGVARFRQHYDVPQLMAEGRLLRRVIVDQVEQALNRPLRHEESIALHTGIDILQQGGVLAMVREQKEAQRRIEQRNRLAIEQVRDYAIFMVTPEGRMATWNAGVRQVLGWEEADFIGQPFSIIFLPEEKRIQPELELQKAKDVGCAENDNWQVKRDGARFWASGITTAIRDEQGQLAGYLKVMRDLTERKLMEEQLSRAKQQAEAANRAKDEFLAVLSHELRTPLTPVLLAVSLLERHRGLPDDVREDIETIRRSVELEARLIDDLLDLTRITRGKLQLNPETIDAHLLIRRAMDLCCRDQPHEIIVELGASRHHVHADPARMQQVLWNLLNNAIKFTPPTGRITVRSSNRDDHLRIEVADTGIGIEPAALSKIFDAFEQGDPSTTRQFGGLGLGLSISRRLMEMQGGSLHAQSAGRGRGATFIVEMPTARLPIA